MQNLRDRLPDDPDKAGGRWWCQAGSPIRRHGLGFCEPRAEKFSGCGLGGWDGEVDDLEGFFYRR